MDKEILLILKKLSLVIDCKNRTETVADKLDYLSTFKEILNSKYSNYKINQIIELTRIERLYDLNIITEEEKEVLISEYNEYKELCSINTTSAYNMFLENAKESNLPDEKTEKRFLYLQEKLVSYGIISVFNYEAALINQIDSEIKQKILYKELKTIKKK